MKLWAKGYTLDKLVEQFSVGDDYILDQQLVAYDCIASLAHAAVLKNINILSSNELNNVHKKLLEIHERLEQGDFAIAPEDEDCHTAIENFLGDIGKKIHTGRSRNDQVLVALRLYMKVRICDVIKECLKLIAFLIEFASTHKALPIPGRTHMQLAMPSSLGLWAAAMAESLSDDIEMLKSSFSIIDQCPLGSASSYGSALANDRQLSSDLLGFAKVQNNVLYANNSRGKFESIVMSALNQIMQSLSKMSSDLMFFSLPEIGYMRLPEQLCSGSSLMPQKRNPCALELIRAKSATMQASMIQVLEITRSLPSGYHRDFQESKAPLMKSFDCIASCIAVMLRHMAGVEINAERCLNAFCPELFATDEALALALEGMAFRDAYAKIARSLQEIRVHDPINNILKKNHLGATGNLNLTHVQKLCQSHQQWLSEKESAWEKVKVWFFNTKNLEAATR